MNNQKDEVPTELTVASAAELTEQVQVEIEKEDPEDGRVVFARLVGEKPKSS